ncbi:MAG: 5-oxoprolinase subunit PxpA [Flavihumibacter sp.]
MQRIDINCDLGEEAAHDEELLPFISSINIACGAHAGNKTIMQWLVEKAGAKGIAIGAHPGYHDREHFGRRHLYLPAADIYRLVFDQVKDLHACCETAGFPLRHVKLHGALYNQAAADPQIAMPVCDAIHDIDPSLKVFGLSGSIFLELAAAKGLQPVAEVFADRRYTDEGTLVPRTDPRALIERPEEAIAQALQLISRQTVTTLSGKMTGVKADTICLHGDGPQAVDFAKQLYQALQPLPISIQAL